jgi:hypothetical protein
MLNAGALKLRSIEDMVCLIRVISFYVLSGFK